jgi:hypothetical protein
MYTINDCVVSTVANCRAVEKTVCAHYTKVHSSNSGVIMCLLQLYILTMTVRLVKATSESVHLVTSLHHKSVILVVHVLKFVNACTTNLATIVTCTTSSSSSCSASSSGIIVVVISVIRLIQRVKNRVLTIEAHITVVLCTAL